MALDGQQHQISIPIEDLRPDLASRSSSIYFEIDGHKFDFPNRQGFEAKKEPQQYDPVKVTLTNNLYNTPAEIYELILKGAIKKKNETLDQLFTYGFLAGTYIALGSLLAIIVADAIDVDPDTNLAMPRSPGLQKFVFGAVFPVGLVFVLLAGSSLFTGNCLFMMAGWLSSRKTKINIWDVLRVLVGSWISNFAGSLFVAYFLGLRTGLLDVDPWRAGAIGHAVLKAKTLPMDWIFFRSIGCNWLVCLAVWLCVAAKDLSGKIWGIWWPIMAFVAIGFEHSVANMFFIPMGILLGADVTWGEFFSHNLLIVTCGNFIGGGLFVGAIYWYYLHGSKSLMSTIGEDGALWHCCNVGTAQLEAYHSQHKGQSKQRLLV